MSTTIPINIAEWSPSVDEPAGARPAFTNPVPATVVAGGRHVGELDAYLAWDGDFLLARVALPSLPGHIIRATCSLECDITTEGACSQRWIRAIEITIEHNERGLDAPPARRGARVEERGSRIEGRG